MSSAKADDDPDRLSFLPLPFALCARNTTELRPSPSEDVPLMRQVARDTRCRIASSPSRNRRQFRGRQKRVSKIKQVLPNFDLRSKQIAAALITSKKPSRMNNK